MSSRFHEEENLDSNNKNNDNSNNDAPNLEELNVVLNAYAQVN
jgi:hypothetical protein